MNRPGFILFLLLLLITLPATQAHAACSSPTAPEGNVMYNNTYHVLQYCNGTSWIPVGDASTLGASAACAVTKRNIADDGDPRDFEGTIWGDNTYVYAANYDGSNNQSIGAYSFNGTTLTTLAKSANIADDIFGLWGGPDSNGNGAYIYAAVSGNPGALVALSYNGGTNTWSAPISTPTGNEANDVWSDGTYIYVASDLAGVQAFTFNGTAFSGGTAYDTPGSAIGVWGDGTYIYVADEASGIRALTWNGTAWTSVASYATPADANDIYGDGTYIYVSESFYGMQAFSFNGSAFTLRGSYTTGSGWHVYAKGGFIYLNEASVSSVFKFNGTNFTVQGYRPGYASAIASTWVDNNYQYVLSNFEGISVYPKCN